MTTAIIPGQTRWSCTRDSEGHREYKITHKIRAAATDGPANVLATAGLPIPGSQWAFDADADLYAWCRPDAIVTQLAEDDGPCRFYTVEQTFSTKPLERNKTRCVDESITDPLLEPQKVSGGFVKYTEEAVSDLFGNRILSSSHEMLRGPQNEWDNNRPTVRIEQNVAVLNLDLCSSMVDSVNAAPLWGLPPRTIKLSNFSWERQYHGLCYVYYRRMFEFDINRNTWDRSILDTGTKALRGHWDGKYWILEEINGALPDPDNPQHFNVFKDRNGENAPVVLNGYGIPAGAWMRANQVFTTDFYICIQEIASEDDVNDHTPFDVAYWLRQTTPDASIAEWSDTTNYEIGNIVLRNSTRWIARRPSTGLDPLNQFTGEGGIWIAWVELAGGITDVGEYEDNTPYSVGNRVQGAQEDIEVGVGRVYVAKYPSKNFLLLGIPTVF